MAAGGLATKPPQDVAQRRRQDIAADPEERRHDQRQDDLQDTLAERSGRPDERLPQRGGIGFEHGPDVALGDQHLVPGIGKALADDRQAGEPGRELRRAGEIVLQATRPLRQTLAEAGRHCQQGQDNDSEREQQQQRRRQSALQPASEQEIAQRPRGNGQDRAEQDRGGEGSQHRQNAEKQTCEEQEQDGALEELRGAGRGGDTRLVSQGGIRGIHLAIAIDHLPMRSQGSA